MAAVVATDEWPRRSLTVAMSTPFSSRRDAWLWRTVSRDAPLGSPSIRQSLETVPDYSRSIPRQTTALANDPSERFSPSCCFVGALSVRWRVGTLAAAAASPLAKPPAGVVAAPGCPPTPARDRWLDTARGCCLCVVRALPRRFPPVRFLGRSGPEAVPR